VDWIDPECELDSRALKEQVAERVAAWVPAWEGWTPQVVGDGMLLLESQWSEFASRASHFRVAARASGGRLQLSRQMEVRPSTARLIVIVAEPPTVDEESTELEILVGDQSIHRCEIPKRRRNHRDLAKIEVPLDEYMGQRVTVTIVPHATNDQAALEWLGIDLTAADKLQPAGDAVPGPQASGG
jgi:hypothetical protein